MNIVVLGTIAFDDVVTVEVSGFSMIIGVKAKKGNLILDIDKAKAKFVGGAFGLVRKKAGEKLMEKMREHAPFLEVKKVRGNIQISHPLINVKSIKIVGNTCMADVSPRNTEG